MQLFAATDWVEYKYNSSKVLATIDTKMYAKYMFTILEPSSFPAVLWYSNPISEPPFINIYSFIHPAIHPIAVT